MKSNIWLAGASFLVGSIVMLLGIWMFVGFSDVEHVPIRIDQALLLDEQGRVELLVDSCNGAPTATVSRGEEYFEIEVRAFRFKSDRDDCQDVFEVFLDRTDGSAPSELLDVHSGELVAITRDP